MTTEDEVDEFLEHFGVKGMHWGVRKARTTSGKKSAANEQKTSKKVRALQITALAGVIVGAAVLAHHAGVKPSSFNQNSIRTGMGETRRLMSDIGRVRASSIPKAPFHVKPGAIPMGPVRTSGSRSAIPMPPVRGTSSRSVRNRASTRSLLSKPGEIDALRSSIARTVREANSELRARDNALNVPFAQRTYLKEWD
jgi:hypothetical protein